MSRLHGILKELINRGKYYSAAWTADSSSAWGTRLTENLTLPKGTYVIMCKIPIVTGNFTGVALMTSSGVISDFDQIVTGSQQSTVLIEKFDTEKTVYLGTAGSGVCSYSYKDRGGMRAIRIA